MAWRHRQQLPDSRVATHKRTRASTGCFSASPAVPTCKVSRMRQVRQRPDQSTFVHIDKLPCMRLLDALPTAPSHRLLYNL
jgi:hypothetical protein